MRDLVHQWIQDRLGVVLIMSPEAFARKVKDGHLLAELLRSYEIITDEQLEMVTKSESRDTCLDNFHDHIKGWLAKINVHIEDEDIIQIVNSKGTAALNLFYQVFLELYTKNNLHYISQQRLNEKLHPETKKFSVQEVKQSLVDQMPSPRCQYGAPLEAAYDIVHWQQDRLEMLLSRCKEAREEYMSYVRSRQNPNGSFVSFTLPVIKTEYKPEIEDAPTGSSSQSYEELFAGKKRALRMEKFVPDPDESKRIWKRLHIKQKKHAENIIFKKDLERDILREFWEKVNQEEEDDFTKNITDILVKQSLYEKQMVQKLAEVKLQKGVMIENKRLVQDAISKQRDADFVERLILRQKELNEKEFTYYLEKERLLQLHRRLYEEKLRLKSKRHYNMCLEAVQDILDVAMKEFEYKEEFQEEPSRRIKDMWRKMFLAAVPLDDLVKPLENIIKKPDEIPECIEEIVHLEIDRQDCIDEKDFESYMAFEWPWTLDGIELEENSLYDMECGLNVLGSLVNNLLVTKYPYPPLPVKPDFPNIEITVCINGFNELMYLPMLQKMLEQRKILVVEMQDAVNFCMDAYNTEMKVEVEVEAFVSEIPKVKDKKGKEKPSKGPKSKKGEKGGKGNKGSASADPVEVLPAKMDRLVQTPKVYPCEEIPLSTKAELGKIADDELSLGQPLTDYLLVAMFVEYIKSKPEIKGWVLVNYPVTYEQAALLEEALTGLPVPDLPEELKTRISIYEIAELDNKCEEKPLDDGAILRRSKLLPNPVVKEEPLFYDTALTAYIKVIQQDAEDPDPNEKLPPEFKEPDSDANTLDRFYSDLGCNYSFYYKKYDFDTIKYLAKLVIGDYSIPSKTSLELFGDSVKYIGANYSTDDKLQKGSAKIGEKKEKPKEKTEKIVQPEGEDDKGKKDKDKGKKKAVIVHEDKFTQIPEVEEEIEEIVEHVIPPKPGESGWKYTHFPFPEELQIALASLWENSEEIYKEDFRQVFFLNRIVVNAIMPFVNFVKTHMHTYITRPDDKQFYLRDFQRMYNDFDDDIRNDDEFKGELHYRINEMKERLFDICDRKMMEAEQERCDLIRKQWGPKQFIELVNNYINAFQLELDRFVDSLLLVGDYYIGAITKMPSELIIPKEHLPKLNSEDPQIIDAVNSLLENIEDNNVYQHSEEFIGDNYDSEYQYGPYVQNIEEEYPDGNLYGNNQNWNKADENDSDGDNNAQNNVINSLPFRQKVEDIFNLALEFVLKNQNLATATLEGVKVLFSPQPAKGKKPKSPPKKDKKGGRDILTLFEPAEIIRQNAQTILDEWSCVIRGETARVKIRLNVIMADLFRNLTEVLNPIRRTFHSIFDEIRSRYESEMDSVRKCCLVLKTAVEEEVKIQAELLLKDAKFYIDPEFILFPDRIPATAPISEINKAGVFTIEQLDKMVDILLDLAPSGYIPQRCFLFLLQDWVISEDGPVKVPQLWTRLEPPGVNKLLKSMFDHVEYMQWKDFIIYNLMVPFPSESDLLQMRDLFRKRDPDSTELIADYQFLDTKLWFEASEVDKYRLRLMKRLIFKIYRVRHDKLNYTAMLLGWCKDPDPKVGLAKALALSIGKLVCWDKYAGEQFVDEILSRRQIHEGMVEQRNEEMRVNKGMAEEILDGLIDKTVHICDSVVIEDLEPFTELTDDDPYTDHYCSEATLDPDEYEDNLMSYLRKIGAEDTTEQEKPTADEGSSNTIGFEAGAGPPLVYFLAFDVLITVITTCLPWHARVLTIREKSFRETVESIYEECRNPNFNSDVLVHEFLNHPRFKLLLAKTSKFLTKNPVQIVENILKEQERENERDD